MKSHIKVIKKNGDEDDIEKNFLWSLQVRSGRMDPKKEEC